MWKIRYVTLPLLFVRYYCFLAQPLCYLYTPLPFVYFSCCPYTSTGVCVLWCFAPTVICYLYNIIYDSLLLPPIHYCCCLFINTVLCTIPLPNVCCRSYFIASYYACTINTVLTPPLACTYSQLSVHSAAIFTLLLLTLNSYWCLYTPIAVFTLPCYLYTTANDSVPLLPIHYYCCLFTYTVLCTIPLLFLHFYTPTAITTLPLLFVHSYCYLCTTFVVCTLLLLYLHCYFCCLYTPTAIYALLLLFVHPLLL